MNRVFGVAGCVLAGALPGQFAFAAGPNVVWTRQIGTAGTDQSFGVGVDGAGNAYISGVTDGNIGGPNAGVPDVFLTKYDAAGVVQWSRQIGTSGIELGFGVAVDSVGNSYISGSTNGSLGGPNAGGHDIFLTKYDAAGTLQWTRQIGTTLLDRALNVAVDSGGNPYITGQTSGSLGAPNAGSDDAFIVKYNAAGTLQWSRQIGTTTIDRSYGVALDGTGNAFITGHTSGNLGASNAGGIDAFVAKYDAGGTLQWTRQIGTANDDVNYKVAVDGAGNAYIGGYTSGSLGGPNAGGYDAFLTKYDATGTLQWTRQLGTGGDDLSFGVAVDGAGNPYISGHTNGSLGGPNAGDYDAFLAMYDPAGTLQWTKQIGTASDDRSFGMTVDSVGRAYLTGYTAGSLDGPNAGGNDAFLIQFAAPEPASLGLLSLGAAGLMVRRRQRNHS